MNIKTITFLMFSIFSYDAWAQLIVNSSIETFDDPRETRKDITVINRNLNDVLYVSVDAFEVMNPGEANQELVAILPTNNPKFLVTPNKLIIQPGGRSIVRFLNLNKSESEESIYRVNFTPVEAPLEIQSDLNDDEKSASVEVLIAYQVLVMDRPIVAQSNYEYKRKGNNLTFTNSGNTNYLLFDGEQCNPVDLNECERIPDHRVYAGNTWTVDLPFDAPVRYTLKNEIGNSTQIIE